MLSEWSLKVRAIIINGWGVCLEEGKNTHTYTNFKPQSKGVQLK
jgi:hypothetical protein